jgi:hypothetical protein
MCIFPYLLNVFCPSLQCASFTLSRKVHFLLSATDAHVRDFNLAVLFFTSGGQSYSYKTIPLRN